MDKPLSQMSLQEIFDKAVGGVLKQGRAAMSADGASCVYRAPDGTKCAAGHLIEDDTLAAAAKGRLAWNPKNEPGFENLPATVVLIYAGVSLPLRELDLISSLQSAHDGASHFVDFIGKFVIRSREVAQRFGLDTSVLGGF